MILLILSAIFPLSTQAASSTYTVIPINTAGSPRGYTEFLPGAYTDNPTQKFPVMIFLHGVGNGGDGSAGQVPRVANNVSPPRILREAPANTKPEDQLTAQEKNDRRIKELVEQQGVIVLSPQAPGTNTWWSGVLLRPFLDFVLAHYRVDPRRVYLTGLSGGSGGINDFFNVDSYADQVTAALPVANRGTVDSGAGAALAIGVPYWGLTNNGDSSNTLVDSVNNIAAKLTGSSSNVMAAYPGNTAFRTAKFHPSTGWIWQNGVIGASGAQPQITLYNQSGHDSWTVTYRNIDCWRWMFGEVKPAMTVSSPAANLIVVQNTPITFTASATDADGAAVPSGSFRWFSNLDGQFAVGRNVTFANLTPGVHTIACRATDAKFRCGIALFKVTVTPAGGFTAHFDLGNPLYPTAGNWNNVTDYVAGKVANAISTTGSSAGIRFEITNRFENINAGNLSSAVYPETAQRDIFYLGSTNTHAEMRISGLNPAQAYDFTFFASRSAGGAAGSRTSLYTINGQSVSLDAANNTTRTAILPGIVPDSSGGITLAVDKGPVATQAYLGVITISTLGPSFQPIAINCGEMSSDYTAAGGIVYQKDKNYVGGNTAGSVAPIPIAGTEDDAIYQRYRFGIHGYSIPVPNGHYNVTLKFADNASKVGMRVFNVSIEGQPVLQNFDIRKEAAANTAVDKTFPVDVTDGEIAILLSNVSGQAKINGLLIAPAP